MNNVVFVVICEDRHTDVSVDVYRSANEAVNVARERATEYAGYNSGEVEEPARLEDTCLYHGTYSCEGDNIAVYRKEIK